MTDRKARDVGTDAGGQIGLFRTIVGSLQKNPPYLLVFGVILLNYLYCVALVVRGEASLYLAGSMAFMALVALATVWAVESGASHKKTSARHEAEMKAREQEITRLQKSLADADRQDINIADRDASLHLQTTISNVRTAMKFENEVFRGELRFRLKKTKEESDAWEQGHLITDAQDYERILHLFYREARQTVFATCNKEYLKFWQSPRSVQILRAHEEAYRAHGVLVTRVFVFSSIVDVEPED